MQHYPWDMLKLASIHGFAKKEDIKNLQYWIKLGCWIFYTHLMWLSSTRLQLSFEGLSNWVRVSE